MKPIAAEEQEEQAKIQIAVRIPSDKRKRPYGLCASAGISTSGMTPGEAWAAWDQYRKEERESRKKGKKSKPGKAVPPVQKIPQKARRLSPVEPVAPPAAPKGGARSHEPVRVERADKNRIEIPSLNQNNISAANSNSMFDRGTATERDYQSYADKILSWDIPDSKKVQLIEELHKRFDDKLRVDAQYVPWTVSGPARYPSQKMNARADSVMKKSAEISDWFEKTEKSVKESKRQYNTDYTERAKKEERWFMQSLENGWYDRGGKPNPTLVANGLASIAKYDTERFIELYEKYDKQLHFRKGTTAAKIYESAKEGTYKGIQAPKKLHESDNLNTYQKTIDAGERVFLKFTTRPKPQMIYALKKRGWHWNSLEGAWSIKPDKYNAEFVSGIDERYAQYL